MSVTYKQIPNLPPAITLGGLEELEIVQSGVSKRSSVNLLTDYLSAQANQNLLFLAPLHKSGNNISLTTVQPTLGGTGLTNVPTYYLLYGNDAEPMGVIAPGTPGQFLMTAGGAPPLWSTVSVGWDSIGGKPPLVISTISPAPKLTVGPTPPSSPAINDLWVDTN